MDQNIHTQQFHATEYEVTYHEISKPSKYPTVILIHGTGGNTEKHFSYIFPMLGTQQRVLSIDLVTPNKAPLSLEDFAQQVIDLIEHATQKNEQITLVGYSLGAVIAAKVAAILKQRVSQLVLLAGWAKTSSVQKLRNVIWQQLYQEKSETLAHFVNFCLYSDHYLSMRSEQHVLALAQFVAVSEDASKQRELNYHIDIIEDLADIQAKTLVIACTEDKMVPVEQVKFLFAGIEQSCYVEIPSGHAVHIEAPAEVVQHIQQFNHQTARYSQNMIFQQFVP